MMRGDKLEANDRQAALSSPSQRQAFWAKVRKEGECLLYPAGRQGYGLYCVNQHQMGAHRYSLIIQKGLPDGSRHLIVRHKCRNRNCVEPEHLEWGTHADNKADNERDGTHWRPTQRGSLNNHAVLTEADVISIYDEHQRLDTSAPVLAKKFNVSPTTIVKILAGLTWKHVTNQLAPLTKHQKTNSNCPRRGQRNANAKLDDSQAIVIFEEIMSGQINQDALAQKYGVSNILITRMKTGLAWRHLAPKALLDKVPPTRRRVQVDVATRAVIKQKMLAGAKMREIAAEYGISMATASNIRRDPD